MISSALPPVFCFVLFCFVFWRVTSSQALQSRPVQSEINDTTNLFSVCANHTEELSPSSSSGGGGGASRPPPSSWHFLPHGGPGGGGGCLRQQPVFVTFLAVYSFTPALGLIGSDFEWRASRLQKQRPSSLGGICASQGRQTDPRSVHKKKKKKKNLLHKQAPSHRRAQLHLF